MACRVARPVGDAFVATKEARMATIVLKANMAKGWKTNWKWRKKIFEKCSTDIAVESVILWWMADYSKEKTFSQGLLIY